jgi:hypothetical protein
MKRIRLVLLLLSFLLATSIASAAQIKFAWDPMPSGQAWQGVRVYDITSPEIPVLACTSTNPAITECTMAAAPRTARTYAAKSYVGDMESDFSNSIVWPGAPAAPAGLKYTITITVTTQ